MIATVPGTLPHVASRVAVTMPSGGMPVYTTSKAAVHGMTRSFARDLGPHRIRVPFYQPV